MPLNEVILGADAADEKKTQSDTKGMQTPQADAVPRHVPQRPREQRNVKRRRDKKETQRQEDSTPFQVPLQVPQQVPQRVVPQRVVPQRESEHLRMNCPSSQPQTGNRIYRLSNWDVLCGRERAAFHHTGNRRFRITIGLNFRMYMGCKRADKSRIIDFIYRMLRDHSGARFVKQCQESRHRCFVEVPHDEAKAKISHACRDMIANYVLSKRRKKQLTRTTAEITSWIEKNSTLLIKDSCQGCSSGPGTTVSLLRNQYVPGGTSTAFWLPNVIPVGACRDQIKRSDVGTFPSREEDEKPRATSFESCSATNREGRIVSTQTHAAPDAAPEAAPPPEEREEKSTGDDSSSHVKKRGISSSSSDSSSDAEEDVPNSKVPKLGNCIYCTESRRRNSNLRCIYCVLRSSSPSPKNASPSQSSNTFVTSTPDSMDILLDSGGRRCQKHPGNSLMRFLVQKHKDRYHMCHPAARGFIIREILEVLNSNGARFLKRQSKQERQDEDDDGGGGGGEEIWEEVTQSVAYDRLNDALNSLANQNHGTAAGGANDEGRLIPDQAMSAGLLSQIGQNPWKVPSQDIPALAVPGLLLSAQNPSPVVVPALKTSVAAAISRQITNIPPNSPKLIPMNHIQDAQMGRPTIRIQGHHLTVGTDRQFNPTVPVPPQLQDAARAARANLLGLPSHDNASTITCGGGGKTMPPLKKRPILRTSLSP